MRRPIISRILLTLGMVLVPVLYASPAMAVDVFQPCTSSSSSANGSDVCNEVNSQNGQDSKGDNPVIDIIKYAIDIVSLIIGIGSVVVIIISGIRLTLSGGDPKATQTARSGITYSLIGIVVALIAQSIVVYVLDKVS